MGIMMVTSLNSYVKNMEMTVKWKKKQEEKNDTLDNTGSASENFQKKVDEMRYPQYDRSSQMEADIEIKLTAGKKLSGEEMQYLKNHDRSMYQKAKIIKRERDAYEKALASCKTKDEVEQLKADYASAAVRRLNAIRNDSGMSVEKKKELFQMEHFKAAALDDAMHEFEKSTDYKRLPEETRRPEDKKDREETNKAGFEFDTESVPIQTVQRQELTKETVLEAVEYEVPKTETDNKKEKDIPEESTDDACEEGSIMKAILDEEARWAREEEENESFSLKASQSQDEEPPQGVRIRQAKMAYLAAQAFLTQEETAGIDLRR